MSIDVFSAWGHGIQTDGTPDCGCTDGNYTEAGLMEPIERACVD